MLSIDITKEELKELIRSVVDEVVSKRIREIQNSETVPYVQPLHLDYSNFKTGIWCENSGEIK